ncbi:hypothetical protein [Blastococcus sp. CT_GayMR16]|uniref:hypothetical protein n=1 Tax=Blastococcus sp. CT_GayMR16 TaxID=2559607 RepID=UPI00107316ED|nr:hypothetical protein [Blastococcus sp. CT_GayMR16]TFV90355.1 hypothetical protein E4P38_02630 [Blastococcus sp. CT_GayMR16]
MKVVFLSHSPDTGTVRVGSHHLAREFARRGHAVFHLSTPLTAAHIGRVAKGDAVTLQRFSLLRRPRRGDAGDLHGVPWQFLPEAVIGRAWITGAGRHRHARRLLAAHGFSAPDVVLVDQPTMAGLALSLPSRALVYRPTDSHFHGVSAQHEALLVAASDAVIATSDTVLNRLPGAGSKPSMTLENGVEYDRFAAPSRAGQGFRYVGAIDDRFDWRTVYRLASALPAAEFRLAGPVTTAVGDPPPNLYYEGPIPYEGVPEFLAGGSVGILPLTDMRINDGRSPMKFYEYLASGLFVLATSSPALTARQAPGVSLFATPEEAVAMATALAAPGFNHEGQRFAKQYDWAARAALLEDFLTSRLQPAKFERP